MDTLGRILRLWRVQAYLDLLFLTQDARRAGTYVLSDLIITVATFAATLLVAERFGGIGEWSKAQVVFMLGYGLTAHGLLDVFFGYNVKFISRRIGRGQLDHTLLRPHSIATGLLTEGFMPFSGFTALVPGVGLVAWAAVQIGLTVTPAWLALLVVQLVASGAVVLSFHFIWGTLAFWAPRGAEELSSSTNRMLDQLRQFPLDGVGPAVRSGLMTVLPVGFAAWYPCRALLGLEGSAASLALTPLAGLLFVGLATFAFRRGLAHYARTGSSRYSDFGHRR
ncbi:MAG TPA: ABC-2 family transporter protein [Chloroflexota bacterium]